MAPPRCLNRQDDIFLFFSNSLHLSPTLPFCLSSFSFFISSSPPLSLSALKGKYFVYAPSSPLADPVSSSPLVPSLSPPPPPPLLGRPTNNEIPHLQNHFGRRFPRLGVKEENPPVLVKISHLDRDYRAVQTLS